MLNLLHTEECLALGKKTCCEAACRVVLLCWGALLKELDERKGLICPILILQQWQQWLLFSLCVSRCVGHMSHGYMLGMHELFAAFHFQKPFLPSFQGNSDFRHKYLLRTLESWKSTFKLIFLVQAQILQAYQVSACKSSFKLK